ncbi:TPR repeat-containing protein [Thermocrinis albus DSM 14484]|uniref:TPR repeat-containing protein n=1 Tax=Thermocrinis albus (strain DSM 14484 / JCM 11386 / HI 11/12) TaxID=638303 RepID=D3SMT2_THEAH|nr:tetratricopeptide repeat protein [Thermocrinis albus]ADC90062.1 TPR repeat-containing protein [Thermocrinis albus DSM 14484]
MRKIAFLYLAFILFLTSLAHALNPIDECANYLNAKDYVRAIQAGQEAVKLYPRSVDAYFCLGIAYYKTGQLNLALENFKKAEAYAVRDDDLMYIYNWLGSVYDSKGDLDNALLYHSRSLDLAKKLGNRKLEATQLNNIALIFDKKGELDKALSYYEESLRLQTNELDKAPTYNNIAVIYDKKGDYTKAIEYFKKAIDISTRYGDYHGSGIAMLNLGNTYRKLKDFDNAYFYLDEGLKRVKKVGDKYWEGVGYKNFGWYFMDKGDKKLAKDYLNKAYEIFKSIGAEAYASQVLSDIASLERRRTAVYGGVEIGAKGVKAIALEITLREDELYDINELFRENINTTIIAGVKEKGEFTSEGIEETAQAVKTLINKMREKGVPGNNIFLVASSAITAVKNKEELSKRIEALTGYRLLFLTAQDEVLYNIAGALPPKYYYNSIVVDVGSGNTKIGYLEKVADSIIVKSFEIPYGSVSLTEEAIKRGSFKKSLTEILHREIIPLLNREKSKNPAYVNRKNVFLIGGAVWALSTLQKPEQIKESYVKLTATDIEKFLNTINKNPEKALNPDISKLKPELKDRAQKQIEKVKDVFTQENLISGISLLNTISKEFNFGQRQLIFPRYGNWLIGYVMLNGYWIEKEK